MHISTDKIPIKVLVTGAAGFLGSAVVDALRSEVNAIGTTRFDVVALTHADLDICDAAAVLTIIGNQRPDWVVHCAAIASTAYCKEHPEASMAVNVGGTVNVAKACREHGARLVYCSSDQVYSGCLLDGPLAEDLQLEPNNPYGAHKLLMEKRIQSLLPTAIGLRLSWMFSSRAEGIGIIRNLRQAIVTQTPLKACTRELRGMTHVAIVAQNITKLILRSTPGGVYNFGSSNVLTTFETLQRALAPTGHSALVVPDDSWTRNLSMDLSRIAAQGITFPSTFDGLLAHIAPSAAL